MCLTLHFCFCSHNISVVILDEAHLMLKSNTTENSKMLLAMETPRRIALTGTPFQNNLFEYYRMIDWIRPGCLAKSESEFGRTYVDKITSSMTVSFISFLSVESKRSFKNINIFNYFSSPTLHEPHKEKEKGCCGRYIIKFLLMFSDLTQPY